jgi:hypothetical protein
VKPKERLGGNAREGRTDCDRARHKDFVWDRRGTFSTHDSQAFEFAYGGEVVKNDLH